VAGGSCDLLHDDAIRVFAWDLWASSITRRTIDLAGHTPARVSLHFSLVYLLQISFLAICGVQKNTLFSFQYFSRLPDEKVVPVIVTVSFSVNPTILWHA